MPKQEVKIQVKKDLNTAVSVGFFTLVGVISFFTVFLAGFFTFALPKMFGAEEIAGQSLKTEGRENSLNQIDRYFETIK